MLPIYQQYREENFMYQSTADIINNNPDALNFLYQLASRKTDWSILTDPHTIFNFPGGLVPRPENPILGNFQYSSYRCPTCGQALYKVIFPENNEPHLVFNDVTGDAIDPARIFTCPDCLSYFASAKGYHLTDNGAVVMARFNANESGLDMYNAWFEIFNLIGDINARRME